MVEVFTYNVEIFALPAGPCAPVSPFGPLGPCAPVSPFGPCGPCAPVFPFGPCAPVAPLDGLPVSL